MIEKKKINWSKYNKELESRGRINFYFTKELMESWYAKGKERRNQNNTGRDRIYSDLLIETGLLIKNLLKLPYRGLVGYLKSILDFGQIGDLVVPHFTRFSERSKDLDQVIKEKTNDVDVTKDTYHVLVDSTGLKIMGSHEWMNYKYEEKDNKKIKKRKRFLKLHVCIDAVTQKVLSHEVTMDDVHDCQKLIPLLKTAKKDNNIEIKKLSADGAYHWNEAINYCHNNRIDPLIPLPKNAVLSQEDSNECFIATPRDSLLLRQHDCGGLENWKKETDYHQRSKVETFFARLKMILGEKVYSKKDTHIKTEIALKIKLLNKFTVPSLLSTKKNTTNINNSINNFNQMIEAF